MKIVENTSKFGTERGIADLHLSEFPMRNAYAKLAYFVIAIAPAAYANDVRMRLLVSLTPSRVWRLIVSLPSYQPRGKHNNSDTPILSVFHNNFLTTTVSTKVLTTKL